MHYGQPPPSGLFSATCLGEVAVCVPLIDLTGIVAALKVRVISYNLSSATDRLAAAVALADELLRETIKLVGSNYQSRYVLPE